MEFLSSALIGVFLGFVFGVGCALAVMYSIYMGGYRAAIKDGYLPTPPKRLIDARAKYPPITQPTK
jgi:ABC-type antimicrobial peptide transport system permease subunit